MIFIEYINLNNGLNYMKQIKIIKIIIIYKKNLGYKFLKSKYFIFNINE